MKLKGQCSSQQAEDADESQEAESQEAEGESSEVDVGESGDTDEDWKDEVLGFNVTCSECNASAKTNMKIVRILYITVVDLCT